MPLTPENKFRDYLGDSVYAEFDRDSMSVHLFLFNGMDETNRIVLEPQVLAELDSYRKNSLRAAKEYYSKKSG